MQAQARRDERTVERPVGLEEPVGQPRRRALPPCPRSASRASEASPEEGGRRRCGAASLAGVGVVWGAHTGLIKPPQVASVHLQQKLSRGNWT